MIKNTLLLFVATLVGGCWTAPPPRSTAGMPARSIVVPKEQSFRLIFVDNNPAIIPAGTYRLSYENKVAWYYSDPSLVITTRDYMGFTHNDPSGIACDKRDGRFFVFHTPAHDRSGEIVKIMVKREQGDTDDVARILVGYVPDEFIAAWSFTAAAPTQLK